MIGEMPALIGGRTEFGSWYAALCEYGVSVAAGGWGWAAGVACADIDGIDGGLDGVSCGMVGGG